MNRRRLARSSLMSGLPAVAIAATLIPWALLYHRLPQTVASHWAASGPADASMSRYATTVVLVVLLAAGTLAAVVLGLIVERPHRAPLVVAAVVPALALGLAVSVSTGTIVQNLDRTDWRTIPGPAAWKLVAMIAPLVVMIIVAVGLAATIAAGEPLPPAASPVAAAPGEAVVWSGESRPNGARGRTVGVGWLGLPRQPAPHAPSSDVDISRVRPSLR